MRPTARRAASSRGPGVVRPCRTTSLHLAVGQPILAAAGFQPASTGAELCGSAGKSRLKGTGGQDCPPHITGRTSDADHFPAYTPSRLTALSGSTGVPRNCPAGSIHAAARSSGLCGPVPAASAVPSAIASSYTSSDCPAASASAWRPAWVSGLRFRQLDP